MLRVCVFHAFQSFSRSKVLKEARQNRHLEQGEDCLCNRNGHIRGRLRTFGQRYAPLTDHGRIYCKHGDMTDITAIARVGLQF